MKVLLLKGSARKGNTFTAMKKIAEGIAKNSDFEIEMLDITKYRVEGCLGCDYCNTHIGRCVNQKDDGQMLLDKIEEADVVIFGTPVYCWGISAQTKAVIDRSYMKKFEREKKYKQIGVVAVGADSLEDVQYSLINEQFKSMCKYMGWELIIAHSISAFLPNDLEKNEKELQALENLWMNIRRGA